MTCYSERCEMVVCTAMIYADIKLIIICNWLPVVEINYYSVQMLLSEFISQNLSKFLVSAPTQLAVKVTLNTIVAAKIKLN